MAGPDFRPPKFVSGHSFFRHFNAQPGFALQRGFTLVELIVVMIIIGILGAIGAVRYFDRRGFDAAGFAEQTRAMLRFSQKLAVGQNRPVYTQMNGNTIALCFDSTSPCPATSRVPAIGSNGGAAACAPLSWYCEAPPGTIAYALSPTTASTICFNALGQPGLGASGACNTANFNGVTVNITGDGNTTPVNVAAETGYVY
ncbi:MAG: prepilin-type N-terminal cleavage/methylation domain-containing protein [Pseudomonadota bacterium]|nr:prepilin-type N-terminal cleavage/methylation domain-containing protein [Pseudomonadota bacterium]